MLICLMRFNVRLRRACPNKNWYESISPCWYKAILRLTKNDCKNIINKNKRIKNQPAKLQSLWNFSMTFILMKDSLITFWNIVWYFYLTYEYSHILPESFFEPTTIHRTKFFVQKLNFVIKNGRIQLSNIQANESLV